LRGGRGQLDDLTAEAGDNRVILGFGVADDDVVVGDEEYIDDLALCAERFAGAGGAEKKSVRIDLSRTV